MPACGRCHELFNPEVAWCPHCGYCSPAYVEQAEKTKKVEADLRTALIELDAERSRRSIGGSIDHIRLTSEISSLQSKNRELERQLRKERDHDV